MTGSSPATRRSRQWSSPSRSRISDILAENRHTELSHQDALAAAQAEHERVRDAAIRVFKDHELKEEHRRLQEREEVIIQQQRREEDRIRNEERLRAEEERLRALKLKTVPKLPPEEPPASSPKPTSTLQPNGSGPSNSITATNSLNKPVPVLTTEKEPPITSQPSLNVPTPPVNGIKLASPDQAQLLPQGQPKSSPFATSPTPSSFLKPATSQNAQSVGPASKPQTDQYVVIHQNLKKLRASLAEQAKTLPPLKARMGDMRRELRKSLGQIVAEKGANKKQITTIQKLLEESLSGSVPSAMVDPSQYVIDERGPMEGALRNEAQLPSLFLYLLNIFAKTIINQFINECGAQPKAADPLGVIAAQIFSNKFYHWRGRTLVDILMAKYRVACPVLFGYHGSESTEQGRARLGWRRDGTGWAPEQQHIDRMKGLAVGYAAISLRDFSRSPNTNPWPPSKYWTSLAKVVNTPPAEISNTQCVVLRGMIEIYEERFIYFYGSAAIAALRLALVDFPNKAQAKTPGTSGLQVLAQMLKRDIGLEL
ncbi:GLE1-like protein-domain-containing protein [Xylaria bambusicola]|uniref:GLE1-like protein-domain-containing protein n=1 Tax=Xylaria bambusicola TaxID=326684 RepID=UPI0020088674|nr:GLE1-like protein-domain-containing protein [Xylaria bambusicola]KAI0525465.1 GLE1-like protein-domain-containing protein [Xylaria bambusicola]